MKFLLLSSIHLNTHLAFELPWRGSLRRQLSPTEARSWPALPPSPKHLGLTPVEARRAEEEKASQQQPRTVWGAITAEPPPEPIVTPEPTQASAEGVVVQLGCASPASMKLTLSLPLYKIELHARNYHRIRFLGANGKLPSPFDPCHSIKGVRARVVYSIGQQDAGEIISVELRKERGNPRGVLGKTWG